MICHDNLHVPHEKKIDLVASENIISPLAKTFFLTGFSDRYYLSNRYPFDGQGYPVDHRWGNILLEGNRILGDLLKAEWVDPRPLSGTHAMFCLLSSFLEKGELVATCSEKIGGHFATPHLVERIGCRRMDIPYDMKNARIDMERLSDMVKQNAISKVFLDTSHFLFPHDIDKLRKMCPPETLIFYDASHVMGLIAGGEFQAPLSEGADILHGTVHKSFPGPQKAIIAGKRKDLKEQIDRTLYPKCTSNSHLHHILALYATAEEHKRYGKAYARQLIANAMRLSENLKNANLPVRGGEHTAATMNHQFWMTSDNIEVETMAKKGIRFTALSFIPSTGEKGFRIGLNTVTRLGFTEKDIDELSHLLIDVLRSRSNCIRSGVSRLMEKRMVQYSIRGREDLEKSSFGKMLSNILKDENLMKIFEYLCKDQR